jgi:hypothetical protein
MKKSISDLYEQMLLGESEKNSLQNPSNDEVGKLPSENAFGSVPKTSKDEGPEKAKLQKGPSYNKIDTGTNVSSKEKNTTFPKSKPAKNPDVEEGVEMEDEEVMVDQDETEPQETFKPKKNKPHEESFNMSAFEELFKKTLNEEADTDPADLELEDEEEESMDPNMVDEADEAEEAGEEDMEETEEDLISDLKSLQDKLNSILSKLENLEADEDEGEDEEYSEDDFDGEFGEDDLDMEDGETEEEMPVKESKQVGLKPVNKSKIKTLQHKNNKVGKVSPKGGKAKANSIKVSPNPKALGDKKKPLQSGNKVKSSIEKGEFFK